MSENTPIKPINGRIRHILLKGARRVNSSAEEERRGQDSNLQEFLARRFSRPLPYR